MNTEFVTLPKESGIKSQRHGSRQLPLETLVDIFLRSLPSVNFAQASQKTTLALVCRLWNTIVESTPGLWSRISIADDITYVRKSLRQSGEYPIDVYGVHPDPERHFVNRDDTCCRQFFREVNSHAHRWRHVALQVMLTEGYAPSVTFFPLLESLELHSNQSLRVGDEYLALLNDAEIPHLREALLNTTRLARWDISLPSTLTKLVIQNGLPSSFELLLLLAECPNLSILHLSHFHSLGAGEGVVPQANTSPVVQLAALQELELNFLSFRQVQELLERLRFPEDCAIAIIFGEDFNPTWAPALSLYHERFHGQIDHVTIFVALMGSCSDIHVGGWRRDVHISPRVHEIRHVLEWVGITTKINDRASHLAPSPADFVGSNNLPTITLDIHGSGQTYIEFVYLAPILDLQCITRIKTTSMWSPTAQISLLSYLSEPQGPLKQTAKTAHLEFSTEIDGAENHVVKAWIFPRLRELVLGVQEDDVLKAVINTVKGRSRHNTTSGLSGRPARLERIDFSYEDDEGIQDGGHHSEIDPKEAQWSLLLELLGVLDEDAEVFWCGKRILKAGIIE